MSLVYRNAFAEALFGLGEVVDVETEGTVVQPVVRVVLRAGDALRKVERNHNRL